MGEKLNSLRNALAHSLEHPLEQRRLDSFYRSTMNTLVKLPKLALLKDHLRSAIYLLFVYILGVRSSSLNQGGEIPNA